MRKFYYLYIIQTYNYIYNIHTYICMYMHVCMFYMVTKYNFSITTAVLVPNGTPNVEGSNFVPT